MEIQPLSTEYLPECAALFSQIYKKQRLVSPLLPHAMGDQKHIETMLDNTFKASSGLVALENGHVVGYLCWFLVNRFRNTDRKGAYVPEWGHACIDEKKPRIYQALYRTAGEIWFNVGCQVHAITLLAHDQVAEKAWYWSGFGMAVVDAIRPVQPLETLYDTQLIIRKATLSDVEAIAQIDAEHWQHYSQSPIFMVPKQGRTAIENCEFLSRPKNSIWVAEDKGELAGFMRFEGYDFDNAAVLESEDGVSISGAYVRPAYRGQKLAIALLDAALRDYQSAGFKYCAVNFESFNPEATAFWMRHFEPVCLSLIRVPEK